MDKSKSEKLKEVLNQTLSTEDIEKKLKEEMKNNAINKAEKKKKEKEREEQEKKDNKERKKQDESEKARKIKEAIENLETRTEKEEIKKHDNTLDNKSKEEPQSPPVIIPSIREKKKEKQGLNLLLYLIATIAVLLLAIVIYMFNNDGKNIETNTKSESVQEKILVKKNDTEKIILQIEDKKEPEEKVLTVQSPKVEEPKKVTEVEELKKEELVQKEVKKVPLIENVVEKIGKPKEIIKIKEVIKEKIITKTIKLDKSNFKKYYNSTKYNTLKCYNFKAGDIFPNAKCKSDLKKFLNKNKNAIRFEVIPVIAEEDNKIFTKMESNIKSMDKTFQDKVKEYMFRGLSRERVLETSWQIKDTLGEDTVLTPTNYYVKSKKNNKGIIIKAYH